MGVSPSWPPTQPGSEVALKTHLNCDTVPIQEMFTQNFQNQ